MTADLLQAAFQHLQELHLVPQARPPGCAAQNAPERSEHSAAGGRQPKVPPRACARYAEWFYAHRTGAALCDYLAIDEGAYDWFPWEANVR